MSARRVSETITRLAQIMTPLEANVIGKVFGGSVLALIDLTASATAQKFAGVICVTAAVDRVDFHEPIEVGNLLETEGHVSYVGRTSLEVTIDVYATNLTVGERRHTNTARVTMVALGPDGRPTPVPRLACETRDEKMRFLEGHIRREVRKARIAQMEGIHARLAQATDGELDELIAEPSATAQFLR